MRRYKTLMDGIGCTDANSKSKGLLTLTGDNSCLYNYLNISVSSWMKAC